MRVLYIGDIMGSPGRKVVEQLLPKVRAEHQPDIIVAQAENVSHGKGMTVDHMRALQRMGIDFFTGGNHSAAKAILHPLLESESEPVIGPANLHGCPGPGWKVLKTKQGDVLFITILGNIVPQTPEVDNPLLSVDAILEETKNSDFVAKIVNFHGDYSSEKRVIGYYLDGRVDAVVGDHWHVPTADAMILPKGTAHITDVGTCGPLHSSIGLELGPIIDSWKHGKKFRADIETEGTLQFNAVIIDTELQSIQHLHLEA